MTKVEFHNTDNNSLLHYYVSGEFYSTGQQIKQVAMSKCAILYLQHVKQIYVTKLCIFWFGAELNR